MLSCSNLWDTEVVVSLNAASLKYLQCLSFPASWLASRYALTVFALTQQVMEDVLFIKLQDCFSVNYFLNNGSYYCINGKEL